jgi:hypothetical protein
LIETEWESVIEIEIEKEGLEKFERNW